MLLSKYEPVLVLELRNRRQINLSVGNPFLLGTSSSISQQEYLIKSPTIMTSITNITIEHVQAFINHIEQFYQTSYETQCADGAVIYRFRSMEVTFSCYKNSDRLIFQRGPRMVNHLINWYNGIRADNKPICQQPTTYPNNHPKKKLKSNPS